MSSERQENSPDNPWWGEHVHRYELAFPYLKSASRVLDIACGSGFGSFMLSEKGHSVTGADLSEETIQQCRKEFKNARLEFVVADATSLPFANEYFDAIVSFETIEHTTKYREVLSEFKRVLKKDGIILISTPNIVVNSPDGVVRNPFHTQEWNYMELSEILRAAYPNVKIYGQSYQRYKHLRGLKGRIGKLTENLLYLRGVRKLPLSQQNWIMQILTGKPMYPVVEDYALVSEPGEINACKTFFAVCSLK